MSSGGALAWAIWVLNSKRFSDCLLLGSFENTSHCFFKQKTLNSFQFLIRYFKMKKKKLKFQLKSFHRKLLASRISNNPSLGYKHSKRLSKWKKHFPYQMAKNKIPFANGYFCHFKNCHKRRNSFLLPQYWH